MSKMHVNQRKKNEGKEMKSSDLATCFKQRHDNDDGKNPVTELASHNTHSHIHAHTNKHSKHTPCSARWCYLDCKELTQTIF